MLEAMEGLGGLSDKEKELANEVARFILKVAGESDRAAVIIGAARLDVGLEGLLKKVMSHHPGSQDSLFDQDRALGSFAPRIALAYRLGLISDEFEHALQMIRKIRNDFAHSIEDARLSDPSHKSRLAELKRATQHREGWNQLRQLVLRHTNSDPLADFCASIGLLMVVLEGAALKDNLMTVHFVAKTRF
jgi:hypothetical protein